MNLHRRALGRARARYFCRHKSTQKGLQQKGFFAHTLPKSAAWPLPCKTNRTTGCNYFAPIRLSPASAKTCYAPCSRTFPALFCPFSPEAGLLRKTYFFQLVRCRGTVTLSLSKGRAQRPCPPCFDWLSMTPVFLLLTLACNNRRYGLQTSARKK